MTGPIFDTHAHYSARAFDADRFALLDSLPAKGVVGVCEQATHSGDAPRVLELAHRYPWVVAAIGIHPESLLPAADCGEDGPAPTVSVYGGDWAAEMRALAPCYEDPKVVAVGECGLDRSIENPDSSFSMNPKEFASMVKDIRQAEKAIGRVQYGPTEQEKGNLQFRRSIFCVQDIQKGQKITEDNIRIIRPGNGLQPKYYKEILGQTALRDIERGTPLSFEMIGK